MLRSRAEPVKDSLRRALSGASLTEPARPRTQFLRGGEGSLSKDFPGKRTSPVELTQGADQDFQHAEIREAESRLFNPRGGVARQYAQVMRARPLAQSKAVLAPRGRLR